MVYDIVGISTLSVELSVYPSYWQYSFVSSLYPAIIFSAFQVSVALDYTCIWWYQGHFGITKFRNYA